MKTGTFRNSSKMITSILSKGSRDTMREDGESEHELEFSTFRSEDFHYQDYLPHDMPYPCQDELQCYTLGDLTHGLESDDSFTEDHSPEGQEPTRKLKMGTKKLQFRNSKARIDRILHPRPPGPKTHKMNFKNKSSRIAHLLGPTLPSSILHKHHDQ